MFEFYHVILFLGSFSFCLVFSFALTPGGEIAEFIGIFSYKMMTAAL